MSGRTLSIAPLVAVLALLAGCAGGSEEDIGLADRLAEADGLFKSRQYEEAGVLFEAIASDAESAGDTSLFVEAAAMRARSYLIAENKDEGRTWLLRAAAKAVDSDPAGWSRYL